MSVMTCSISFTSNLNSYLLNPDFCTVQMLSKLSIFYTLATLLVSQVCFSLKILSANSICCQSPLNGPVHTGKVLWSPVAEHGFQLKLKQLMLNNLNVIFPCCNGATEIFHVHLKCPENDLSI